MRIPLNIPGGDKQRMVIDHFNAALRVSSTDTFGTALFHPDGSFESSVTGGFTVDAERTILKWTFAKNPNGMLEHIDVMNVEDSPKLGERWQDFAHNLVTSTLAAALAEKKNRYFMRRYFNYIGPQLDGEYWLPGFRFAPAFENDPEPALFNAERVVTIDMYVDAIDENNAYSVANESTRRNAARLSLLLNTGLYQPRSERRWVILPSEAGTASLRSERLQLGFAPIQIVDHMPKKGEISKMGKFSGSLQARYVTVGLLSLPPETRKILRALEDNRGINTDAFDRCARLYQVATIVGSQFPSVALAYRVAAVEALTHGDPEYKGFSDFIRKNVGPSPDLDEVLEYLYNSIRSAHFHAGEFPMGEYSRIPSFDPLMDSAQVQTMELQRLGYQLTRDAIISWLSRGLPEISPDEDTENI